LRLVSLDLPSTTAEERLIEFLRRLMSSGDVQCLSRSLRNSDAGLVALINKRSRARVQAT
jgi:hypothetical protein